VRAREANDSSHGEKALIEQQHIELLLKLVEVANSNGLVISYYGYPMESHFSRHLNIILKALLHALFTVSHV
jgi:hypothetical protein